MKKILSVMVSVWLLAVLLVGLFSLPVSAGHQYGTNLTGSNTVFYNYSTYGSPVYSYMTTTASGDLMTVSASITKKAEVAYYTPKYKLYKTLTVNLDLPLFGGFYETENYYFLLTGQTNYGEDNNVEVFRVTRYDKNWNKKGSVGLCNCNTTYPFDAGSARFAHSGNTLVIRTCHEMYKSPDDGLNHQANMTFSVNIDTMSIITSHHGVASVFWGGYVSHSFNQFIRYDGSRLVAVDHGDAYPRSIVLVEYGNQAFFTNNVSVSNAYSLFNIPGQIGDNETGVSVGGFEISPTTYLTVGNTYHNNTDQTDNNRDIFVSALARDGSSHKVTYLTNYTGANQSASTPQLVKVSNNYYMVLWWMNGTVYYVMLNGRGEKQGSVRSMKGSLSDCVPIVVNKRVQWYTYSGNNVTFYSISTSNLSTTAKTTVNNGHDYVYKSDSNYHWKACKECGNVIEKESHKNADDLVYLTFSEKGYLNRVCNTCDRVFSSKKVAVSIKTDGADVTPTVKVGDYTLTEMEEYWYYRNSFNYDFDDNGKLHINRITMTFWGRGGIAGEFQKEFYNLSAYAKVASIATQTYTGKAVKPTIKVTANGKTLKAGTDYTLSCKNNTKVGTATVTITGKGSYFGTIKKTFKIKRSIATAKVTGIQTKTYTGKALTQSPKVVYGGKTLKKGTDYTLTYKNNTAAGTATVKIVGKGNYTGTITKTFKIKARSAAGCKVSLSKTIYTYSGKTQKPTVTIKDSKGNRIASSNYTVTYAAGRKNVGTYKVKVTFKKNYTGTRTLTFKIAPVKTSVKSLTASKKTLKVAINRRTVQVSGYQIQYATNKQFKNAKLKTLSGYKKTTATLTGLSKGKTYYVRVRTYKKVNGRIYYSGWSTIKYKKTK